MERKSKKENKKILILLISIFVLMIFIVTIIVLYRNIHGVSSNLKMKVIGEKKVTLEVGNEYKDKGVNATYKDNKLKITKKGQVDTTKIGKYTIEYIAKYKKISKKVDRVIEVVDTTSPEIKLEGDIVNVIVGNEYNEPGVSAIDNYDGDITDKIEISNNIDINTIGEYEVTYKVKDSSNNEVTKTRKVLVVAKKATQQKVAVLNYHFFYDPEIGESCPDGNCKSVQAFRQELDYLKNNNFKTLTMKEFRDWMYGVKEIPEKSVLITIDDGAMGTGTHNGNKLIPILEEYKMHATLFLITGWWDIGNYKSKYLDIESHTNDMHNEGWCTGVSRGARMLCQNNEQVLNDLKASINITGSKLGFCFPFYAYDDRTISLVKEAGFELAFIGGGYKASRSTDKWHIPRYQIKSTTTLETFKNYVN